MKYLLLVCCTFVVVNAGVISDYSSSNIADDKYESHGSYGKSCTTYMEPTVSEECEAYSERVCTTTQKESCSDVTDQSCRAIVSSKQNRKCFNVTEERCSLKEDISFDTIQVPFVVQKCQKVNERVCDTVYEASSNSKDRHQCITVVNPSCESVDHVVYDKTCRSVTEFDCSSDSSYDNYGPVYDTDYSKPSCKRKEELKCYKTPRTVSVLQCSRQSEKICENLQETSPFVVARQSCRNEEKRVCDLEERSQPKQVKKYSYRKDCVPIPRQVCEFMDEKVLVPSCVATVRKECSFSPVESCTDEPKRHCYKITKNVKKEKCDNSYSNDNEY